MEGDTGKSVRPPQYLHLYWGWFFIHEPPTILFLSLSNAHIHPASPPSSHFRAFIGGTVAPCAILAIYLHINSWKWWQQIKRGVLFPCVFTSWCILMVAIMWFWWMSLHCHSDSQPDVHSMPSSMNAEIYNTNKLQVNPILIAWCRNVYFYYMVWFVQLLYIHTFMHRGSYLLNLYSLNIHGQLWLSNNTILNRCYIKKLPL